MATPSNPESGILSPLPTVLRHGLVAVGFLSVLSFVSTVGLLIYLTYKFLRWHLKKELGEGYNQFIILVYNLLLADVQQAVAFALTLDSVARDEIEIGKTCWAQGWFVSTGDLASSLFIFAIAIHTFFAVVKSQIMPPKVFAGAIIFIWTFNYTLAITGIAMHPDDLYNRAGAWCWIDTQYTNERLWLHYFWLFISMFGTILIYIVIYLSLHFRLIQSLSSSSRNRSGSDIDGSDPRILKRAARYMILYPIVYVVTTLPLAAGRMAAMNGDNIPLGIYCYAGAAISSSGWLDCLLYAGTRRALIFSDKPKEQDIGLKSFGIFHAGEGSWAVATQIAGPLTKTPIRGHRYGGTFSTLHKGKQAQRYSRYQIKETPLPSPVSGVITTHTVIEIEDNIESDSDSLCQTSSTTDIYAALTPNRDIYPAIASSTYPQRGRAPPAVRPMRAQPSSNLKRFVVPQADSKRSSARVAVSLGTSRLRHGRTSSGTASGITIKANEADDVFG